MNDGPQPTRYAGEYCHGMIYASRNVLARSNFGCHTQMADDDG